MLAAPLALATLALCPARALAPINTVQTVAPGIHPHEGDSRRGHRNNGWMVFDDFVLVIDANDRSGTKIVMPQTATTTDKPVRFAFNAHHRGDHPCGNQPWADAGATLVASTGSMLDEMKKVETGAFGGKPGRWEASAKTRRDVAASKLKPPVMRFPEDLFRDDGKRRVELRAFGTGHTNGDA